LRDAVERWAEIELSKRSDGGKEPMRAIRKDVLSALGDRDLVSIKRGDILEILDTIMQRGADRMANRVFTDMKQFFRWAFDRELIPTDPLQGLGKGRVGGKDVERDRFFSAEEIRELHEKLPAAQFERPTELVIWIMLSTLCRVGEIIQARWEHVDLVNREWLIPAENAKNKKNHTVFLSDFALKQFQELRAISHWRAPRKTPSIPHTIR
jgi:integrase